MSRPANILLFFVCLVMLSTGANGQVYLDSYLANQLDIHTKNNYRENVFLIPDRDVYFAGDDLKLTIFLTEGKYNFPVALSKAVAIEVIGNAGQPLIRQRFSIDNSRGSGIIHLPSSLPSGHYILRAYTNWMRNDGAETYFHTLLTIINPLAASQKLPEKDPDELNIEFQPEGGHLVAGIESRVVVRISDQFNRSFGDYWQIISAKGDSVTSFRIGDSGLGIFKITPLDGTVYGISYKDSLYALPPTSKKNFALKAEIGQDEIKFNLYAGSERPPGEELMIIAHQDGELSHIERIRMNSGSYSGLLSTSRFPKGISEIAFLDETYNFLAGRLVYKPGDLGMGFSMNTDEESYSKRDTVVLSYETKKGSLLSISAYLPAGSSTGTSLGNDIEEDHGDLALIFAGHGNHGYARILEDKKLKFLPEIRGEIISGSLINGDLGKEKVPDIYMARLGWNSDIQIVEIRDDGTFFIAPGAHKQSANFVFLKNSKEKLSILIHPEFSNDYAPISIPEFDPESFEAERIEELLLSHQLRALYQSKSEEDKPARITKFYGEADQSIQLKDYINLPVMEEFFRELLKLTIFTRENGELKLNVLSKYTNRIIGPNPLYLVDGIPVFDTKAILDLDPEHIKSVHIKAHKYVYGNIVCDGIIELESIRGDGSVLDLAEGTATFSYRPPVLVSEKGILDCNFPAPHKNFPDMRSVICWQPGIVAGQDGHGEIRFTTSDLLGNFLIKVNVLTPDGKQAIFYEEISVE